MTLITMTTVGYGEVHPLSHAGRVFNSFLIMFGVTTIFIAIGAMTQTIIELEFGDVFNKRRNKRMIEKLNHHHIICGFGRVGRGAAEELQRAGAPFVVVDSDPARAERAMMAGMLAVAADATHDDSLRQVGVERAHGLVAALATDADNLFVLLSAKALNPDLYVAARAAEEGAVEKMRRAGASSVIAPYALTGHRLAQSLLRQVLVAEGCETVGKTIRQMQLSRDLGVIVMAIRDCHGKMHFNPPADAAIQAGDTLIAMGGQQGLRALEVLLAEPPHTGRG
jgi:voltage-gated potassium channel